jgi:hypothetical protein
MKTPNTHHVWDDFNDVSKRLEPYLENKGQGTTMASQVAACVSNLVYHFFNDGDIFDTTHHLKTTCNDFSSRANWLYLNQPATRPVLDRIEKVRTKGDYADLLFDLCEIYDADTLASLAKEPAKEDIYKSKCKFSCEEEEDDDEPTEDWPEELEGRELEF